MKNEKGYFAIPTRLFLTASQRQKLETLMRDQERELPDLLTDLLTSYLEYASPEEDEEDEETGQVLPLTVKPAPNQLQQWRVERRRLRARLTASNAPPPWLVSYLADLEEEIARLETEQKGLCVKNPT